MSERCLSTDYMVRGHEFELWRDYNGWYLVARPLTAAATKLPENTVLTGAEFDPPLTATEIQRISNYVFDRD